MNDFTQKISNELQAIGVRPGGVLMVHSSLKSLGWVPGGAETVIQALLFALGTDGTLLMPALTYGTVGSSNPCFDLRSTPSCVGIIPETFRLRAGTKRSLHPTHSVCASGSLAKQLLTPHQEDSTPCGPNSPFHRLPDFDGQILMLGCGLLPNTSIHALEEIVKTPYALKAPMVYTLINENGEEIKKAYSPHHFAGYTQRYDRVTRILKHPDLRTGSVMKAHSHLMDAVALKNAGLIALEDNPLFFVEPIART
jgi:aminoglycoside 3-N-acetyltransferase